MRIASAVRIGLAALALVGGSTSAADQLGAGEGTMVKLFYAKANISNGSQGKWKFEVFIPYDPYSGFNAQFAIKYVVNGQEFWDNNGGADYKVSLPSKYGYNTNPLCAFGKSVITLDNAAYFSQPGYKVQPDNFYGALFVKNLGPTKSIKLTYSTDGWKTSKTVDASYFNTGVGGVESWKFTTTSDSTSATAKFFVTYVVNGTTIYDNNFGRDYTVVNGFINE